MMGAVAISPVGGLRQRLVLGRTVREKYSMQSGRVKDGGRFRVVKELPVGGILEEAFFSLASDRSFWVEFRFMLVRMGR